MMNDLVSRKAVLDALHTQLEYPTEACAIVRTIPNTDEYLDWWVRAYSEAGAPSVCPKCGITFPSHEFHCGDGAAV